MPPLDELTREGGHVLTVCKACPYCEQYCPVFPAMEQRLVFAKADLHYLANLCHNCGECLYACQYAPPHEFGIDVPRTFSEVRVESYEAAAWPAFAARAFRRPAEALGVALLVSGVILGALTALFPTETVRPAEFYAVMPHAV